MEKLYHDMIKTSETSARSSSALVTPGGRPSHSHYTKMGCEILESRTTAELTPQWTECRHRMLYDFDHESNRRRVSRIAHQSTEQARVIPEKRCCKPSSLEALDLFRQKVDVRTSGQRHDLEALWLLLAYIQCLGPD